MVHPTKILHENVGSVEYCSGEEDVWAWELRDWSLISGSANDRCDPGKVPSLNLLSQPSRELHNPDSPRLS